MQTESRLPAWQDWPGWQTAPHFLKDFLSLVGHVGSMAHNTMTPETDDIDLMAVATLPIESYCGLHPFEEFRHMSDWQGWTFDVVVYDIRKFVRLLLKQNPNVLCLLALKDHSYLKKTDVGRQLIAHRHLFFSKKMYQSFTGYAYAQLQHLKRTPDMPSGRLGEKRKQLIDKYGWETKAGAHLMRLLRMGTEFLSTGELNVWREDAPVLIGIKRGEWTISQVETEATRLFRLAEEALVRSPLPEQPDTAAAESLLVQLIKQNTYR